MQKPTISNALDIYQVSHLVDAKNPRNFYMGHHIISDQISRESLGVVCGNLEKILQQDTPGDVVEFGCYVGTTSVFIRRLLDQHRQSAKRQFHVYDPFAGLPPKSGPDRSAGGEQFTAGKLAVSKRELLNQFHRANLKPPIVHKGWFNQLMETDVPEHVAFAFLDGDFYESIIDSLRLVYPRMQPGGIIAIDDCGREALPGVDRAVHDFFRDKPQKPYTMKVAHNIGIIQII